mgnify:CR=1 FL=1
MLAKRLAGRVAARVIATIDSAIGPIVRRVATAVRLAGVADAVVTGIGNGAGVTVANLFCVTAPGKKLIANRLIFKQIVVTLRCDELRKQIAGDALARLRLLDPRRIRFLKPLDVNLTALLVWKGSLGFQHVIFEGRLELLNRKPTVKTGQVESALRVAGLFDIKICRIDTIVLDENIYTP